MCDTLIKRNLSQQNIPKFVYKRVQKIVGESGKAY